MQLPYYKNLDGMRGIAALMVVVYHFFGYPISGYISTDFYAKLTEFGQHGVSMFFVLSGFVITRILIKNRGEADYFKTFYWRRSLRIFPLYYLFLIVWFFLLPMIVSGIRTTSLLEQLPFYIYIQNLSSITGLKTAGGPGHYWTLAIEEHFYLIWPFVVYLINPKLLGKLIIFLILIVIPIKYYLLTNGFVINKLTFTRFDQILLGALLAYLELNQAFRQNDSYFRNLFFSILISVIPLSVLVYFAQRFIPEIKELIKYNLLGLVFFALIGLLVIEPKSRVIKSINTLLISTPMQYLGKISYGIYVWHILVLVLLDKFLVFEIIVLDLFSTLFFTICIAHLSFFYFESKIIRFR